MSITFLFLYNTLQCYLFYKFKYSFFSQQLPFSPASPTSSLYCNIPINKQKLCNSLHFKQIRHALPFLNPMAPPVVTLFLIPLCSKLLKRVFCICHLHLLSFHVFFSYLPTIPPLEMFLSRLLQSELRGVKSI